MGRDGESVLPCARVHTHTHVQGGRNTHLPHCVDINNGGKSEYSVRTGVFFEVDLNGELISVNRVLFDQQSHAVFVMQNDKGPRNQETLTQK